MLRTDYLPRIADPAVVNNVFNQGRKAFEVGATPTDVPTMPIEFSIAAFRLGHAMIRQAYDWNAAFPSGEGMLDFLFIFSGTSGDLFGGVRLPSNWIVDWRRLYDFKKRAAAPTSRRPVGQQGDADRHHARPPRCMRCRAARPGTPPAASAATSRSATCAARGWCGSRPASRWSRSSRARASPSPG